MARRTAVLALALSLAVPARGLLRPRAAVRPAMQRIAPLHAQLDKLSMPERKAAPAPAPVPKRSVTLGPLKAEDGDEVVAAMAAAVFALSLGYSPAVAFLAGAGVTLAASGDDAVGDAAKLLGSATRKLTASAAAFAKQSGGGGLPSVTLGVNPATSVLEYFDAWNRRDMRKAASLFSTDCTYEDTLYSGVFQGRAELKKHLVRVAASLPDTFAFVVDEVSASDADGGKVAVGVQWHVEDGSGRTLPFARGASMYQVDRATGLITSGFDVPEPTVKSGGFSLGLLSFATGLIQQPLKVFPAAAWGAYCYILFLSTEAPGVPATALDPQTWEEVKNLSFNFWLILPQFFPQYAAPATHPVMEGIFNFTLAWAGMFAIFAADGREGRGGPRMGPVLLGMQFLTNAFLLPYLVLRKPETPASLLASAPESALDAEPNPSATPKPEFTESSLSGLEKAAENKLIPLLFGGVMTFAAYWAAVARPEFGDLPTRLDSYLELAKSDRLTFAFLVDLVGFSLFQGWLVDDDMTRRGVTGSQRWVYGLIAKLIPAYGLVIYGLCRPGLSVVEDDTGKRENLGDDTA
mmetsp:Transcript_10354/g.31017  ORF Transcript_10354/g.31017 Transcript_10354/m.31017 type:complete len:577 (-) Transcript_10354:1280-3010(-)|eukprot:CAMPEP_0118862786 /NCGR_PEP_ID=MMETSP1163-20130328/7881_1 /TAXON_ID=124430 /ORGANISM="Phaeomonas parva, Strain CCMP2877" /LENGTH=576 /DNA_ID=CAMNT_0006796723 /DNA_START=95 /DNA_END=1825 /DNA_ORIENTATION=-